MDFEEGPRPPRRFAASAGEHLIKDRISFYLSLGATFDQNWINIQSNECFQKQSPKVYSPLPQASVPSFALVLLVGPSAPALVAVAGSW